MRGVKKRIGGSRERSTAGCDVEWCNLMNLEQQTASQVYLMSLVGRFTAVELAEICCYGCAACMLYSNTLKVLPEWVLQAGEYK